jgi:dTDP-4-dehydrorhamnose 3,5-epimerase-like enzyme
LEPKLIKLHSIGSPDVGILSVYEYSDELIGQIKRVYWINDVPEGNIRGKHFHYELRQLIVCVQGVLEIKLENKKGKKYLFSLNKSNQALFIPNGFWREIKFIDNAILLCIADGIYNEEDYIRDYENFKKVNGII